ncbi:MAG: glycosyltransferase [Phocaeicola vulgatus]|nr:MAG: glycosyltransferase [Phocaeicola vulgatus]
MKVSIIIPVYNVESYLVPCLQSVSQQSFTDFEVWLIDDGSKDRSAEICDSFVSQDPRFHVVHKQNGGVSTARNLGIEKSEGEWICFIDSDDTVEPHYLQNLYEEANGHRDTLIMQGYTKLYTNGKKEPHCFEDETFGKGTWMWLSKSGTSTDKDSWLANSTTALS